MGSEPQTKRERKRKTKVAPVIAQINLSILLLFASQNSPQIGPTSTMLAIEKLALYTFWNPCGLAPPISDQPWLQSSVIALRRLKTREGERYERFRVYVAR